MTKSINITVSDWILSDIIGKTSNRSAKIEEYIIKGYLAEQKKTNFGKESGNGGAFAHAFGRMECIT